MARRGGESTTPLANGGVPPSTIAAQIVNNHSNANAQKEPGTKAVFGQLLNEYLGDPSTDEPDSQLNAQLIYVVTEAGLDVLLQENPFAQNLLIPQATDSISVIKLTIQRRPESLLNTKIDEGNGITRPKLFLWLLPKLLALMGHRNLDAIQENLQDLLLSCVQILQCTSDLWQYAVLLIQLYQSCIDGMSSDLLLRLYLGILTIFLGILSGLDATTTFQLSRSNFKVALPPYNGISNVWPESQQLVALPQGCQITISLPTQAICIAFSLIEIIVGTSEKFMKRGLLHSFFENNLRRAIDNCSALWQCFKRLRKQNQRLPCYENIELAYIRTLVAICVQTSKSNCSFIPSQSAAVALSQGLSDLLLSCCLSSLCQSAQNKLAWSLMHIQWLLQLPADHNSLQDAPVEDLGALVKENLLPTIIRICRSPTWINSLEKELKVSRKMTVGQTNLLNIFSLLFVYGLVQMIGLKK